jgi:hypothetical protein
MICCSLAQVLRLGGRDRTPGEILALKCRRRWRPRVSFSLLDASFGSYDPLLMRVDYVSPGENLSSFGAGGGDGHVVYLLGGVALEFHFPRGATGLRLSCGVAL